MGVPVEIIDSFDLTEDEIAFFDVLWEAISELGHTVTLHRSSKAAPFNVYIGNFGYIGKIRLYKDADVFAVMRNGRKRAVRLCNSKEDAEKLIMSGKGDYIEIRKAVNDTFMQILTSLLGKIEWIEGQTLDVYLSMIPRWIDYCKQVLLPIHNRWANYGK